MGNELMNLVGGQWVRSTSGTTFPNENPAKRGEVLNHAQFSEPGDMTLAVNAAAKAFASWQATSIEQRQAIVGKFLDFLLKSKEELSAIVTQENGKTIREARGEVDSALLEGRYHHQQVAAFMGDARPQDHAGMMAWEQFHPLGVVGIISPWNYPVNVMCRKTLPAPLTGNTVVFKPASFTPGSGCFMAKLFERAGVPAGVFNCVTGGGSKLGNTLIRDPRVRAISFTGSTSVGKKIQSMAAENLTRTQLELGGKNALIVMNDADLDTAIRAAILAGFGCAGQWCTSTSRILLQADIADRFTQTLLEHCAQLRVGNPMNEETDIGPVAGPEQYERITGSIDAGRREGARLLCGGAAPELGGYFIRPAVFDNVSPEMSVFREEIFGPVLALARFNALDEAIELANRSEYGLSSALFTRDLAAAHTYIRSIEAGMAHVNIHTGFKIPALPFGGWKQSGAGLPENGRPGLEFFVERKAVYVKSS